MDYFLELLLTLLPDLIVVVAMFAALGLDYSKFRDATLTRRYNTSFQITSIGLFIGIIIILLQILEKMPVLDIQKTAGQLSLTTTTLTIKVIIIALGLSALT